MTSRGIKSRLCFKCQSFLKKRSHKLQCRVCKKSGHRQCISEIKVAEYYNLGVTGRLRWVCDICIKEAPEALTDSDVELAEPEPPEENAGTEAKEAVDGDVTGGVDSTEPEESERGDETNQSGDADEGAEEKANISSGKAAARTLKLDGAGAGTTAEAPESKRRKLGEPEDRDEKRFVGSVDDGKQNEDLKRSLESEEEQEDEVLRCIDSLENFEPSSDELENEVVRQDVKSDLEKGNAITQGPIYAPLRYQMSGNRMVKVLVRRDAKVVKNDAKVGNRTNRKCMKRILDQEIAMTRGPGYIPLRYHAGGGKLTTIMVRRDEIFPENDDDVDDKSAQDSVQPASADQEEPECATPQSSSSVRSELSCSELTNKVVRGDAESSERSPVCVPLAYHAGGGKFMTILVRRGEVFPENDDDVDDKSAQESVQPASADQEDPECATPQSSSSVRSELNCSELTNKVVRGDAESSETGVEVAKTAVQQGLEPDVEKETEKTRGPVCIPLAYHAGDGKFMTIMVRRGEVFPENDDDVDDKSAQDSVQPASADQEEPEYATPQSSSSVRSELNGNELTNKVVQRDAESDGSDFEIAVETDKQSLEPYVEEEKELENVMIQSCVAGIEAMKETMNSSFSEDTFPSCSEKMKTLTIDHQRSWEFEKCSVNLTVKLNVEPRSHLERKRFLQNDRDDRLHATDVEELQFQCVRESPETGLKSVRIFAKGPQGDLEEKSLTVAGPNCRALLAAADRQFTDVHLGDSPVIFSMEASSACDQTGRFRKAIRCFDDKLEDYIFVDVLNGSEMQDHAIHRFSRRFFRPSTPLPSSPTLLPAFFLLTETEILTPTSEGWLQPAPVSTLADPSFVILLHGVKAGEQIFWELADAFRYVDAESGRVFRIEEIPAGGPKRFVFALLRVGDSVPAIKIPKEEVLFLLRRRRLGLLAGRLQSAGPAAAAGAADNEVWDFCTESDHFDREFTDTARVKFNMRSLLI